MKRTIMILLVALIATESFSQKKELIPLWPGKVPGELKEKQPPVIDASKNDNVLRLTEVTDPAIEVYLPDAAGKNRPAVIICPGGAYRILAYDKEGTEIAAWLNKLGIAAFVLQYRIPDKREGALQDVQRAMRIVRKNASKWSIDPGNIGVIGFSAGGSLSARASILFNKKTYPPVDNTDSLSCRPSFTMLIYPAYLDQGPNLTLTPELQLSKEVPPMYIFQTADDIYGNSALVMAGALRDAKLSVELHLLQNGGHGYGLRPGNLAGETWPLLAEKWLTGILKQKK
jgi:acetyl esterase/lipase